MNIITILCDTLRRDHVGAYHRGRPLSACDHPEQPDWVVSTPNFDRLAERGTVFDQCWCGSTPCMPARRDLYTGKLEFLRRGWGPLEETDVDLPRCVSGPPNQSITAMRRAGLPISYLVSDHFHLWEQGAGNYHMGYTGFEFIRGMEADAWHTDPLEPGRDFACPTGEILTKCERHYRNVHHCRQRDEDAFPARVFKTAADWLRRNHRHKNFYLHLDCFSPHEPWDPPEDLVRRFDPDGYADHWVGNPPYASWREHYNEQQVRNIQARYAASVVQTDQWLGALLCAMDELDLWRNTIVVLTTDHGTFNGDHGRIGKIQTHDFSSLSRLPLIICHPHAGKGERRNQLVQLIDLFPTTLAALDRPMPACRVDGVNLLPAIEHADAHTRDAAICGMFGRSTTVTDGRWVLHQSPQPDNKPLNWYGHCLSRFMNWYELGPYHNGRREVTRCALRSEPTWMSDLHADPGELHNLAAAQPQQLTAMQRLLCHAMQRADAPSEQFERLGLSHLLDHHHID